MHPEKRVVWHPRHDDRFVVGGGTQITLYELIKNNEQHPEIRHVSSRHDLHHMRCFAWSPEPRFNDLIAVGTTTGRVDLIRLQASARSHSKSSVLSAGPTVPLAVRNSRACNALAFSTADPNYLAVGLDKVRGDPSLVIWDLTSTRPLLQIPGESWSHHLHTIPAHLAIPRAIEPQHHSRTDPRILQQHAPTEVVSALSFVPNTTHLLLAGISNRWLRFFDLRAPFLTSSPNPSTTSTTPSMTSSTYSTAMGSTTTASSGRGMTGTNLSSTSSTSTYRTAGFQSTLTTIPSASNIASPHQTYHQQPLQQQQQQQQQQTQPNPSASSTFSGALLASTPSKVQGIAADPLEPHRIACWGGDEGVVSIWDARKLVQPVLVFSERDAGADGGYAMAGMYWYDSAGECPVCGAYGSHQHQYQHGQSPHIPGGDVSATKRGLQCVGGAGGGLQSGWVAGGAGAGGTGVYVQAEWASIRRGTLATLERDSRFVRVWDVLSARPYVVESTASPAGSASGLGVTGGGGGGRKSWTATLPWPRGEGSSSGTRAGAGSGAGGSGGAWYQPMYSPFGPGSGTEAYGTSWNSSVTLVLSNTRRSKSFPRVLSSFALLPSTPSFSNGMGISSKIMVVNKEGDLELYAMHDGPKQVAWSARGDLAISGGRTFKLVTGSQLGDAGDVGTTMLRDKMEGLGVVSKRTADGGQRPAFSRTASSSHGAAALTTLAMLSRRVSGQEAKEKEKEKERAGWRSDAKRKEIMLTRVVQEDISMVMKQRAVKGYGIGRPQHNALVIRDVDDGHGSTEMLSDLWLWIRHSQDLLSTPTSLINEYDFAYQGLSAIWEGFPPTPSTPMTMYVPVHAHVNAARVVAAAARQLYSHSHPSSASQSYTQSAHPNHPYHPGMTTHQHTPTETPTPTWAQTPVPTPMQMQPQLTASQHLHQHLHHHQQQPQQPQLQVQDLGGYGAGQGEDGTSGGMETPTAMFNTYGRYAHGQGYTYSHGGGNRSLLLDGAVDQLEPLEQPVMGPQQMQTPVGRGRSPGEVPGVVGGGSGSADTDGSSANSLIDEGSGTGGSPVVLLGTSGGMNVSGRNAGLANGATEVPIVGQPGKDGQSDYQAALSVLVKRINKNMGGSDAADAWRPPVASHKVLQRQVALQLCGWSVREDDLMGAIRRWEKEGAYPRAACWLVFMKQYDKAVELLMRSNDESHRMMSGTLAALLPSVLLGSSPPSAKNEELRQHCERLIVRLHDPYFRVLLTHLMLGDWSEVLEEDSLPFRERLAIAFQFLSDRSLSSYLKRSVEQATVRGDIDSVIVTGLRCRAGMDILQKYIDRTGDVQSVAILSALAWPSYYAQQQSILLGTNLMAATTTTTTTSTTTATRSSSSLSLPSSARHSYLGYSSRQQQLDTRPERWLEAYRDLLDGFRLFDCRVGFDIERGQVMNAAIQNGEVVMGHGGGTGEVGAGEWVPGQIMIRCRDCGKTVNGPGVGVVGQAQLGKPTLCPHCNRQLPRCSICLMPLEIVRDASRVLGESGHVHKDTIDDAIVICQTCRHGGHASHIMAWYWTEDGKRNHETCAVADCQCRCADEF